MADDLDSFFAKKAAKKSKKLVPQDTDALAKRLEKAVRQQEQIDRCRGEEERILKERIQAVEQQNVQEDSEWLDVEPEVPVDPAAVGLQELNIEEIEEDNKSVNEERTEKPKTWNFQQDKKNSVEAAVVQETKVDAPMPKVYVPPSVRVKQATKVSNQPNLQDAFEFPSLTAAEDMSKQELAKKKALAARKEKGIRDREKDDKRKKEVETKIEEPNKEVTPAPAPVPAPFRYVPPHLRI